MIKPTSLVCAVLAQGLAFGLAASLPTPMFAHVGHGDEFQAKGKINRVPVKAETDSMLGIQVTPITTAADGSAMVLVPITSIVDANGKQIVFVQYKNFYEPVPVTTGKTQGDLVEVTEGLSIGENLVTQGSLSLYAESRKTQNAKASPTPVAETPKTEAPVASPSVTTTAQAEASTPQSEFPIAPVAIGGVAVLGLGGAIAFWASSKN